MAFSGAALMPRFTFDPKITAGNVLTIIALILAGFAAWYGLKQDVLAAGQNIAVLQAQIQPVEAMTTRLAIVERNQVTGKEQREQFQEAATESLDALRTQNTAILQALAALTARLDERDRLQ